MTIPRDSLGVRLTQEAGRMRVFAHQPEHYIHVWRGEHAEKRYPKELRYRQIQPGWETALVYTYSVDVLKDGRAMRHLSVQISVPGEVTQGQLNLQGGVIKELVDGIVEAFFPMDTNVGLMARALAPIPMVDSQGGSQNVHFRTPVVFHVTADHSTVDIESLPEPEPEWLGSQVLEAICNMLEDDVQAELAAMQNAPPMVMVVDCDIPKDEIDEVIEGLRLAWPAPTPVDSVDPVSLPPAPRFSPSALRARIESGEWKRYIPER